MMIPTPIQKKPLFFLYRMYSLETRGFSCIDWIQVRYSSANTFSVPVMISEDMFAREESCLKAMNLANLSTDAMLRLGIKFLNGQLAKVQLIEC